MPAHPCQKWIDYCRRLPAATEDIKWGNDLVFSVGNKLFACFDNEGGPTISFKTEPDTFARLTRRPGIVPAPYAARFHWVMLETPKALPAGALRELIRGSYELVVARLPARVRRDLSAEERK